MLVLDRQTGASAEARGGAGGPSGSGGSGGPGGAGSASAVVSQQAGRVERIQLRLRADGQLFELLSGKTTIGSSPRCNVRIQQPGVQPVHCVIMDGVEGLTVRRWAGNAKLNGKTFEESTLNSGDCLIIGPAELDIVDPLAAAPPVEAAAVPGVESRANDQLPAGRELARSRSRHLLETLRRERAAQGELAQQVNEIHAEFEQANDERDRPRKKFEHALNEVDEVRQEIGKHDGQSGEREELVKQNEQLGLEIRDLSARIDLLTHEQGAAADERDRLASDQAALREEYGQLFEAKKSLESELSKLAYEREAINEQHRSLADENSQLRAELGQLRNQYSTVCEERDAQSERSKELLDETRALAAERSALSHERTAFCNERNELQLQNEELLARIARLDEENSSMAVAKLSTVEQCGVLGQQTQQLQSRIAELMDANSVLSAANSALTDEQSQLQDEIKRLADLDREMQVAICRRESTSEELYRALLQVAELQEHAEQNKALVEVYDTLSGERDQLLREVESLKDQIKRESDERTATESAWQSLRDEAAAVSESQRRSADENAQLAARLEEARQQLVLAHEERESQVALASSATELERELSAKVEAEAAIQAALEREVAAKLQADEAAAAVAAAHEQKLAEQSRHFAELKDEFEHRLAAAEELRLSFEYKLSAAEEVRNSLERQLVSAEKAGSSLEDARNELQQQSAEAESVRAAQARRIAELEERLAAAEANVVELKEQALLRKSTSAKQFAEAQSDFGKQLGENDSARTEDRPAAAEWSSFGGEAASHEPASTSGDVEDVFGTPAIESRSTGESAWGATNTAWGQPATEEPTSSAHSLSPTEAASASDDSNPWGRDSSREESLTSDPFGDDDASRLPEHEPTGWPDNTNSGETSEARQEEVSFAASGAWKQVPVQLERSATPVEPVKKLETTSYIERYAHMFKDDGPAAESAPRVIRPEHSGDGPTSKPQAMGRPGEVNSLAKEDDEESIEAYMAKLLQRVRGDSPPAPGSQAPPQSIPLNAPSSKIPGSLEMQSAAMAKTLPDSTENTDAILTGIAEVVNRDPVKVKVSAPATDLGALRALANETARFAISRHELRKHRRNAVTKVIVSSLAGVTSLWLMLDAPNWLDIQFITACVSLIVAAYWAGETYRTMLESFHVASYDAADGEDDDSATLMNAGLPIDVDSGH